MLGDLFSELQDLLWGMAIISVAILGLMLLPKKFSLWLGDYPMLLVLMFALVMLTVINIFN